MNTVVVAPHPVASPQAQRIRCPGVRAPAPWVRRMLALLALAGLMLAMLMAMLARALEPAPGEASVAWRQRTPLGVFERRLSVPVLLRWSTHPMAAALLDGRTVSTRTGVWRLQVGAGGQIGLGCQPCVLSLGALGPQPVRLSQAHWQFSRVAPDHWQGTLRLGPVGGLLPMNWRAHLRPQALEIHAELPPVPLAQAVALWADALPQARQARISGQVALTLDAAWDASGLRIVRWVPQLDTVRVDGLGTEALLDAAAPAGCDAPRAGRVEGWLPRAVVAALDPHFHERSGDDLRPWLAPSDAGPTLTRQLVRLLYTGTDPGTTRGLREWLYAVEMERTLGKGRILQTYLAVAPWGPGVCGAEAAARHHLGKSSDQLTPREAAWLAGLLVARPGS